MLLVTSTNQLVMTFKA